MTTTQNTPFQTDDQEKARQAERFLALHESDAQFRNCLALAEVNEAKRQPGLRLAQIVRIVMEGYADRPALGQRARRHVSNSDTGACHTELLPAFDTISYAELWQRARALAGAWHYDPSGHIAAGDFACILGFASIDYATHILACIHLGATIVPLQTSAPAQNHAAILAETEATLLAVGIDYLDSAIAAVCSGHTPKQLVVFDLDPEDSSHSAALAAAQQQLQEQGISIAFETVDTLIQRGQSQPEPPLYVAAEGEDPLAWLFYTSGTTGTPKGAMFPESLVIQTWLLELPLPVITLSFMPMSHLVGNGFMLMTLGCGGTSYCAPKSDLSTLFEDFPLARPTMVSLVPRVCEMLYQHFLREVDKQLAKNTSAKMDRQTVEAEVKRDMRERLLGGRLFSVGSGSAALAPEIYRFMESMLEMHMPIGYASTEIGGGTVLLDGKIQRPLVIDYKLADVPELGYFSTDKPYPRGELLVKTSQFMAGYFKRPELTAERLDEDGFYRTGDVMAELGPDHLTFVDRCNNVIKLSQGEFVAVAKLEAIYAQSPLIKQIYLYGTSERAFLLAVIVPVEELIERYQQGGAEADSVRQAIRQSLQAIAEQQTLNGYELPRDFLLETEAFSHANGLISEIGKHLRPKLKQRYGTALEALYTQMAEDRVEELRALRMEGSGQPVSETVLRALTASLGIAREDVSSDDRFSDLGGDSLTALEFSKLLADIYGFDVPVGMIINPAGTIADLIDYIAGAGNTEGYCSAAKVHGKDANELSASDLTLDKFINSESLADAASLPPHTNPVRTVLLTGATGYLGRFLALQWLQQLAGTDGKLILIARGTDPQQARQRIEQALNTDPELVAHFNSLAERHLEVIAGDLAAPRLGLDDTQWNQLAADVDLIVHSGAHVNHLLPYNQLFGPNVAGTAELIRLAISHHRKRFHYVSTLGVSMLCEGGLVTETGDIRQLAQQATVSDSYANGYNLSKWASEVLLREAADSVDLPVSIFRPGMILAHSHYRGQLNAPDMFTRLLFSLVATGVAPATFYAQDLSAGRPAARYEGFNVDFLAAAITAIGANESEGFHAYNLSDARTSNPSLDDFVDWLIAAGNPIERVDRYDEWISRFETALQALPEQQRQRSLLALLGPYRHPQVASSAPMLDSTRFTAACKQSGLGIPAISSALIEKYIEDLRHLEYLMPNPDQAAS